MSVDALINRLLVLYGAPESPDDAAFIDEYRDMLEKTDPAILKPAGDIIRDTHKRRGWPTPGEVKDAVRIALSRVEDRARYHTSADPEEVFEWVGSDHPLFVKALTEARTDAPAYAKILEARGRIKIKKEPTGPMKRQTAGVVTELTKRMTGERD